MEYAIVYTDEFLAHHGVKGMKWGVRRYQNADGSLTAAGKRRYGDGVGRMSDEQYNRRAASYGYRKRGIRDAYIKSQSLNPVKSIKGSVEFYKKQKEHMSKREYDSATAKEARLRYGKAGQYKAINTKSGTPTYVNKKTGQKININDMELLRRNRKEVANKTIATGELAVTAALSVWAGYQLYKNR